MFYATYNVSMSDDLEVRCRRCDSALHHECHAESLPEAAIDLFMWRPESGFPKAMKKGNSMCDGAEDEATVPFLSESFLYPLLGKEDARTLLALVNGVFNAAGIDPDRLQRRAWEILEEKKRNKQEQEKQRAEARERFRKRMLPTVSVPAPGGRVDCTYDSFYVFDVNVRSCEQGECEAFSSASTTRRERRKPKMGKLEWDQATGIGMSVECGVCKRIHHATVSQVEGWRKEPRYQVSDRAKEREPALRAEHLLNAECVEKAFGFKG